MKGRRIIPSTVRPCVGRLLSGERFGRSSRCSATTILRSQQQGSQGGSQSAAGGQSAANSDDRDSNWGWIGLLGLIGLAGLRRREDRTYTGTRNAT